MTKYKQCLIIGMILVVSLGGLSSVAAQEEGSEKWEEHLLTNEWYVQVGLDKVDVEFYRALNQGVEYKMKRLDEMPALFFMTYEMLNEDELFIYCDESVYRLNWLEGNVRYITDPDDKLYKEKRIRKGNKYEGTTFAGIWGPVPNDRITEEMRKVVPEEVEWDLVIYFPNIPRNATAGGEYYLRFVGEHEMESDETYEGGHIKVYIYPDGDTLSIRPQFPEDEALHEGELRSIVVERRQ